MISGKQEQQPVPAAAAVEEDFTVSDMETKCHDPKDMITEVALKSDADDDDNEDNDCKILQSILNDGHYNISHYNISRTALESVITDTSGKEEDMDQ